MRAELAGLLALTSYIIVGREIHTILRTERKSHPKGPADLALLEVLETDMVDTTLLEVMREIILIDVVVVRESQFESKVDMTVWQSTSVEAYAVRLWMLLYRSKVSVLVYGQPSGLSVKVWSGASILVTPRGKDVLLAKWERQRQLEPSKLGDIETWSFEWEGASKQRESASHLYALLLSGLPDSTHRPWINLWPCCEN